MGSKKIDLFSKLKKIKGIEYIVIGIIVILVALVLFGNLFTTEAEDDREIDSYVSSIENRLKNTLSNIKGVGKVSVAVSVNGGNKTVIATDVTTVKNGNELQITETPILVGGKVVVLNELYPEITGVIIVAGGADNLNTKLNILSATTTLLSIDESRVSIITGK